MGASRYRRVLRLGEERAVTAKDRQKYWRERVRFVEWGDILGKRGKDGRGDGGGWVQRPVVLLSGDRSMLARLSLGGRVGREMEITQPLMLSLAL